MSSTQPPLDPATVAEINALRWFHQIDFGHGVLSPGYIKLSKLRRVQSIVFDRPITGKSLLDIGCWDGAQSIEAIRRGASRVLATDHFVWHDSWGDRRCLELARQHLAPQIEVMDIDVPDLTVERVGTFDVVLFLGVFYHLRNPFAGLEQVAKLAKELLVMETRLLRWPMRHPYMRFWPGATLDNDSSNWWTPNVVCVKEMLRDLGFRRIKMRYADWRYRRGIFHAER